jgi:hypothetical protein
MTKSFQFSSLYPEITFLSFLKTKILFSSGAIWDTAEEYWYRYLEVSRDYT